MKTESILRILESLYSKRDSFTKEELDGVSSLIINKIDYDGNFLNVDFNDLDNFNNIEVLIIDGCMLDCFAMDQIIKHSDFNKVVFRNCDVIEDVYDYFEKLSTKEIAFINSNIDLTKVPGIYYRVYLETMKIGCLDSSGEILDVSHCEIEEIDDVLTSFFNTIVLSSKQYNTYEDVIKTSNKKIIIMEDNGQFVDKEVKLDG